MTTSDLQAEFRSFLKSSGTNVELLSDELREAITIDTPLASLLEEMLDLGKHVVLTGTAGSGKTHLLAAAMATNRWNYKIVTDLADRPQAEWPQIFTGEAPWLVAGNEGAFLAGADAGIPHFKSIISALHALQSGHDPAESQFTLMDVAGFDAGRARLVEKVVRLPIVEDYATDHLSPYPYEAWKLLDDAQILNRLGSLVERASAYSDDGAFTFRHVWKFVADMLLGPPNETWITRAFSGTSEVSRAIQRSVDESAFAMPHVSGRLWYGDLQGIQEHFLPGGISVLEHELGSPARLEESAESTQEWFREARRVCAFTLKESPLDVTANSRQEMWRGLVERNSARPLLKAVNSYLSYGLLSSIGDDPLLWLQYDTERRAMKPEHQAAIGVARASDFEIVRNRVVPSSIRDDDASLGGRVLLRHGPSDAVLQLSPDLVDEVLQTRSHRVIDREHVEFDWRLFHYLSLVSSSVGAEDESLYMAHWNFARRSGDLVKWHVGDGAVERTDV